MKRLLQPFAVIATAAGLVLGSPVGLAFADPSDPGTPEPPPVVETLPAPQVPQAPVELPPVVVLPAPAPAPAPAPEPAPAPVPAPAPIPAPVPVPAPAPQAPAPAPVPAPEPLPDTRQPEVKPAPAPRVPVVPEKPAPVQETPVSEPETPATTPRQVPRVPREQVSPPAETTPGGEVEVEGGSQEEQSTEGNETRSNLPTTPGGREEAPAVPGVEPSGEAEPSGSNPSGGQVGAPQGEVPGSAGVVEDPNEGTPVTEVPEVKVVEAPAPAAALPVTEEMLAQPSIEATVQDLSTVDASSDRGPRPGGPVELPEDDGNPPPTTNVNVIGDNNNVTIINVVDSKDVDINVDQGNDDEHFVVMRRLDKPGHEFRFPAPPNRPIRLPHNFCGGEAGVWAVAGAGIGPNGPWANASAGVFATSGRCGVVGHPPRPHYRPSQLTICPPVGWRGQPMFVGNYTYINETTIFANNTYMQGTWVNQTINGVPQQQFQVTGHSANPVFQQQPAAGPPSWSWPDGGLDPQAASSTDQAVTVGKWVAGGVAGLALVWFVWRRFAPRRAAGQ